MPQYIVLNEYEVLIQLARGSGLAIALDTNVNPFVKDGKLIAAKIEPIVVRDLALLANRKIVDKDFAERLMKVLCG